MYTIQGGKITPSLFSANRTVYVDNTTEIAWEKQDFLILINYSSKIAEDNMTEQKPMAFLDASKEEQKLPS